MPIDGESVERTVNDVITCLRAITVTSFSGGRVSEGKGGIALELDEKKVAEIANKSATGGPRGYIRLQAQESGYPTAYFVYIQIVGGKLSSLTSPSESYNSDIEGDAETEGIWGPEILKIRFQGAFDTGS